MTDLIALSGSDIQAALPMPEAIEAMRSAFGALSGKRVELPHRVSLKTAPGAVTLVMPGALAASYGVGAKMVSVFDNNPAKGLPLVSGVTVLFDRDTGQPAAILDAHALTAIRTGAASGLATDFLAIPGAKRMAMLGAGAQARAQIAGVCAVRSIEELRLWSRTRERAEALAEQLSSEEWAPPSVKVVSDPSEAVVGTEIVCTATPARYPFLVGAHGWPGMHINAVGSFTPEMRELEVDLIEAATVVVDHRAAVLVEAGEIVVAINEGAITPNELIELGELVNGTRQGRTSADDITIFKSVGIAVQDLAAGSLAVERAREAGLGTEVRL